MPRLIDADKTIEKLDCLFKETNVKCLDFMTIGYNHAVADSTAVVKGQPAIDAVEVIRCRECKHYQYTGSRAFGWAVKCCVITGFEDVDDDDFCSRGERSDNVETD